MRSAKLTKKLELAILICLSMQKKRVKNQNTILLILLISILALLMIYFFPLFSLFLTLGVTAIIFLILRYH